MERILAKWQYILNTYTDLELQSKSSLIISLLIAIAGVVLAIYILSLPPYLPGTIWHTKKPDGNRTFNESFKDTKEIITYGSKRW